MPLSTGRDIRKAAAIIKRGGTVIYPTETVYGLGANVFSDFIKRFLPGAVTVVLKKKKAVPDILTPGTDLVGIRYPDHRIAARLIECAGVPITSTSANISGEKPPTRVEEIKIEADYRNLYSS